jgi:hypothetical protein
MLLNITANLRANGRADGRSAKVELLSVLYVSVSLSLTHYACVQALAGEGLQVCCATALSAVSLGISSSYSIVVIGN